MVAIMIGSLVYGQLNGQYNISLSTIAKVTFLVASISLFLPLVIKVKKDYSVMGFEIKKKKSL